MTLLQSWWTLDLELVEARTFEIHEKLTPKELILTDTIRDIECVDHFDSSQPDIVAYAHSNFFLFAPGNTSAGHNR
ncbi:MAG: hypothetical protein RIR26_2732 [Pseudomonadota bacterium]|jgi:hypothetical protein